MANAITLHTASNSISISTAVVSFPMEVAVGSLAATSLYWPGYATSGIYSPGSGVTGFAHGGTLLAEFGIQTIDNQEPNPNSVRYGTRFYPIETSGEDESAAIYIKVDPTGSGTQTTGIYMEMTAEQQDTEASCLKIVHDGAGDAVFVASMGTGPAYEAASFHNGSRGFISTCQWEVDDSNNHGFGNSTLFNAVWGFDGTGGSTEIANYGMFYASLSLGHSFRTQMQNSSAEGFAWGQPEWRISEHDFARDHYIVYNSGDVDMISRVSTALATERIAPALSLVGSFYTGGEASNRTVKLQPTMDAGGNAGLSVTAEGVELWRVNGFGMGIGTAGDATVKLDINDDSLRIRTSQTPATAGATGLQGEMCWDSSYVYVCVSANNWRRAALSTWP